MRFPRPERPFWNRLRKASSYTFLEAGCWLAASCCTAAVALTAAASAGVCCCLLLPACCSLLLPAAGAAAAAAVVLLRCCCNLKQPPKQEPWKKMILATFSSCYCWLLAICISTLKGRMSYSLARSPLRVPGSADIYYYNTQAASSMVKCFLYITIYIYILYDAHH